MQLSQRFLICGGNLITKSFEKIIKSFLKRTKNLLKSARGVKMSMKWKICVNKNYNLKPIKTPTNFRNQTFLLRNRFALHLMLFAYFYFAHMFGSFSLERYYISSLP